MSLGLDWINDAVRWLAQWLPHWDVCEPTHRGVKFRATPLRGTKMRVETIEPGLFMWWPVTTRCYTVPVVRQSVNLPPQSLDTVDGFSVFVSCVMVYEIRDVEKALTKNYDLDDTIREIASAAAVQCIATRNYAEVLANLAGGDLNKELRAQARKILGSYGVNVLDARFTDCTTHTCLRTEGGGHPVITRPE